MILERAGLRYLLRHPWQTVLSIIGVALGVAVVTAVDLANDSSERAFRIAAETVAGRATHQVVGGPAGLPEELYRTLRVMHGIRPSAPVVEGYGGAVDHPGYTFRILGIDLFAEAPFRTSTSRTAPRADLAGFMARPGTGLMLSETAERLGIERGGSLSLQIGGVRRPITITGFLQPADEAVRQGLETVLITDIATAQELLGMEGRLSRIDLIVPEGEGGEALLRRVRGAIPAGAEVIPAGTRESSMAQMTRAFRLNLTALSLLALVVGIFLIYNTITFSVVRRRRLIGLLRAIGVTRRQVFGQVLGETLLIGVTGTILGLLLGIVLGNGLTRLVTRTINDLYFLLTVREMAILPLSLAKGAALGLGASLLAAVPPAWEAATAPPRAVLSRSTLEARMRRMLPLTALAGVMTMLAGGGILLLPGKSLVLGFVGLLTLIAGFALFTPGITVILMRLLRPVAAGLAGSMGKMAARGVVAAQSRTGVAVAALVIALSAIIGVDIMIGSFRQTVDRWLQSRLRADIFVTTPGTGTGTGKAPLEPGLVRRLASTPGVAMVSSGRRVVIESARGDTDLFVLDIPRAGFAGFRFKEGTEAEVWTAFSEGEAVLVSEPYAWHHNLHRGDTVRLRTDRGERTFPIAGVYYDYGSDRGIITISRAVYERYWDDRGIDSMGIYAAPDVDLQGLADTLRERSGEHEVTILSNRALREAALAVFDRTFVITGVLRLLAVVVAFVGILSALMAIQTERSRELAVLRAIGLTPAQVWGLVCGETGLIGLAAGILAVPLGIVQALVLILVINRRSFGWTMHVSVDPTVLLQTVALAVGAALLAGIYPALRMARTSPALALAEE